jgi:hypothetical protein
LKIHGFLFGTSDQSPENVSRLVVYGWELRVPWAQIEALDVLAGAW